MQDHTTVKTTYREMKRLDPQTIEQEILQFWQEDNIFEKSIALREGSDTFVFYEGPPSVNGLPGIHHVMSRTIKDAFCRYRTLKGFQVLRKAGWDTHGLPIELNVEKTLGITKEDIGTKLSVDEYNEKCREDSVRYIDIWNDLTAKMGYWVDMQNSYITFQSSYIETLWWLLKKMYQKGLLYKGYTIQPYSPAAGTGLSTHELNQPGCYREVTDTTVVAMFKVINNPKSAFLFDSPDEDVRILAWTTTPWTLPSNTALTVGPAIEYIKVKTINPYTKLPTSVILAKNLVGNWLGGKNMPEIITQTEAFLGKQLIDIQYEQLLPFGNNIEPLDGKTDAFRVLGGDFVTTEDGTGVVHTAPSFGADDRRVARDNGIGTLTLVDKQGKFIDTVGEFSGRYVKNYKDDPNYVNTDVDIAVKLKIENKAFNIQKHVHNYPHCWRTDKPVLYYPLDSWFIRASAYKERMAALNKTIYWKPASTGEGRFGNWLENLQDWNLSRSRFWGTPLPIWRTEDNTHELCIGSIDELSAAIDVAVADGFMAENPYKGKQAKDIDLHRPHIDRIVLVSPDGQPMYREPDLIDVWFDSGAMPYAQWHYPFENKDIFEKNFPADFIAEGVDQTRGWFYTLHAIAVMLFDSVAYKAVVSNGLVLDEKGNKMSKRLGNVVDPHKAIKMYGADSVRWYIMSNSNSWDNLKFSWIKEKNANNEVIRESSAGIEEVRNKFMGTLFNTYSFFALYANIDGFANQEKPIPMADRPEIDRWIISLLNSLVKQVDALYADYDATKATRLIQEFVGEHLSNWYVRLCRRRFWKGEYNADKVAAYQTLYQCLETVCILMSPVAPFISDFIFRSLNNVSNSNAANSVHLSLFPAPKDEYIDLDLEERMTLAQELSSMTLALRKKIDMRVRQPLQKILVPIADAKQQAQIERVKDLILSETNVKEIEYVSDTSSIVTKSIKPDFKALGKRLGSKMKVVGDILANFTQADIVKMEQNGQYELNIQGEAIVINANETIITSQDIEGWIVNTNGTGLTVALDVTVTELLRQEGIARELVNRLQNLRKQSDFNVTDRINITIEQNEVFDAALENFRSYICSETLAVNLFMVKTLPEAVELEVNDAILRCAVSLV